MPALLARLDRLHGGLARWLLPAFVRRLDRSLLLRQPLLWRSSLLPTLCFAMPLAVLAAIAGLSVSMQPDTVWTAIEVDAPVFTLQWVSLVAVLLWALLQLRYPLGEVGAAVRLRVAFYNLLVLSALLLPPQALHGALGERVAAVMSPEAFARQSEFLRGYAADASSNTLYLRQETEIEPLLRSLQVFGLTLSNHEEWRHGAVRMLVADANGASRPSLLSGRLLQNIARHQQIEAGMLSSLPLRIGQGLTGQAVLVMGVLLALTVLGMPRQVWRRRLPAVDPASHRRRFVLRPWLPGWLRRLDRRLLLNRPLLWATRSHVYLFHAPIAGMVVISLLFVLGSSWLVTAATLLGGPAIAWATTCRWRHVPATTPGQWRAMMASFFLATLTPPLLLFLVVFSYEEGWPGPEIVTIAVVGALVAASTVIGAALTANFVGWPVAGLGLVLSVLLTTTAAFASAYGGAVFGSPYGLDEEFLVTYVIAAIAAIAGWLWCALWLVPRCGGARQDGTSKVRPRLAALVVAAAPVVGMLMFTLISIPFLVSIIGGGADPWFFMNSVLIYVIATAALFGWALIPCLRALTRARYAPADD